MVGRACAFSCTVSLEGFLVSKEKIALTFHSIFIKLPLIAEFEIVHILDSSTTFLGYISIVWITVYNNNTELH